MVCELRTVIRRQVRHSDSIRDTSYRISPIDTPETWSGNRRRMETSASSSNSILSPTHMVDFLMNFLHPTGPANVLPSGQSRREKNLHTYKNYILRQRPAVKKQRPLGMPEGRTLSTSESVGLRVEIHASGSLADSD